MALRNDVSASAKEETKVGKIPDKIRQVLKQIPPGVKLWGTGVAQPRRRHVRSVFTYHQHAGSAKYGNLQGYPNQDGAADINYPTK